MVARKTAGSVLEREGRLTSLRAEEYRRSAVFLVKGYQGYIPFSFFRDRTFI